MKWPEYLYLESMKVSKKAMAWLQTTWIMGAIIIFIQQSPTLWRKVPVGISYALIVIWLAMLIVIYAFNNQFRGIRTVRQK